MADEADNMVLQLLRTMRADNALARGSTTLKRC